MKNGFAIFSPAALELFIASGTPSSCSQPHVPTSHGLPGATASYETLGLEPGEETPLGHSGEAAGIKEIS